MIISHILTLYPHSYGLNFEPSSFDGCIMSYPSHVGYPPKQPSTSSSLPRDRGKRFHSPLWARCPPKDLPVGSAWVGRTPGVEPTFYLWEKRNRHVNIRPCNMHTNWWTCPTQHVKPQKEKWYQKYLEILTEKNLWIPHLALTQILQFRHGRPRAPEETLQATGRYSTSHWMHRLSSCRGSEPWNTREVPNVGWCRVWLWQCIFELLQSTKKRRPACKWI